MLIDEDKRDLGYDDNYLVVDVSVYGSSSDIPCKSWPSEQQASTTDVLANLDLLDDFYRRHDDEV